MLAARKLICWSELRSSLSRNDECVVVEIGVLDLKSHHMNVEESRSRMHWLEYRKRVGR